MKAAENLASVLMILTSDAKAKLNPRPTAGPCTMQMMG